MLSGIYVIKNIINNKMYLGSSKDIKKRWKRHKYDLIRNQHHCIYLQRAWNKYGSSNFEFIILENTCDLLNREQHYIDLYNPEYNIGSVGGGDNISHHPLNKQYREKQSTIQKHRHKNMTITQKEEISKKFTGKNNPNWRGGISKPKCDQCGVDISYGHTKCTTCSKLGTNNPFYGKKHTEETKKKLSKSRMGSKPTNMKKINIDGVIYESCKEAAEALNVSPATITYRLKHPNKYNYKLL